MNFQHHRKSILETILHRKENCDESRRSLHEFPFWAENWAAVDPLPKRKQNSLKSNLGDLTRRIVRQDASVVPRPYGGLAAGYGMYSTKI